MVIPRHRWKYYLSMLTLRNNSKNWSCPQRKGGVLPCKWLQRSLLEDNKVIYNNDPLPVLNFIGTAKVHGSNAGITYYKSTDKLIAQSRTRQLSLDHDNMGFYSYVLKNESYWKHLCWDLIKKTNYDSVTIFGEWCGPGIQSGVAVSKLPKKIFIIFSIRFKNIKSL